LDLIIKDLKIPVELDNAEHYLKACSIELQVSLESISIVKILSKEIDLRNCKQFNYILTLAVNVPNSFDNSKNFPEYIETAEPSIKNVNIKYRPIIIGFGPAGMFAALELISYGLKPVIFERGKKIEDRSLDVKQFILEGQLNHDSNIQFGEGGAGSFSDGKLFSRRNKNTLHVKRVLDTFIKFGAPEEIAYISKPHLGTDVLCKIVINIRNYILDHGADIHYSSKLTGLIISEQTAKGVFINNEREYYSTNIYLAVGHSARDTFEMIYDQDVILEQKPIQVGVRMEHPAKLINQIRYGNKYKDFQGLGAAVYSLNYTDKSKKRGVYTFCMCPGGEIVNASSEQGMMVLNGMSNSDRSSEFSNAAIVVSCNTDDYNSDHPLAGIEFQKEIERLTFQAGKENWSVPAQNLVDFMADRPSHKLNKNSYKMGSTAFDLKELFPGFVNKLLLEAFNKWKQDEPLFISDQAVLFGSETRTTSPVKICRNNNFESVNMKNLYPIGEGSGYTSGIVSSAVDAIKAVEKKWGRA
jgi:uncharacterized FAD-dependent dehydrogenase